MSCSYFPTEPVCSHMVCAIAKRELPQIPTVDIDAVDFIRITSTSLDGTTAHVDVSGRPAEKLAKATLNELLANPAVLSVEVKRFAVVGAK